MNKTALDLHQMADDLQIPIDRKYNPNYVDPKKYKENKNQYLSYIERLKRTQLVMRKLAELHESNQVPHLLKKFVTCTSVFCLMSSNEHGEAMIKTPHAVALWGLL